MRLRDMAAPPGFDSAHEIKRVRNWLISCVAIFVFLFACVYVGRLTVVYNSMRSGGRFESMGLFPEVASKSYYTMRRLPNRWEYPLRCALLPVSGFLVLLLVSQILLLLAGAAYLYITPDTWLPAGARESVLSFVLGGILA